MQMTIVEMIEMAAMTRGAGPTVRTVLTSMIRVMLLTARIHGFARQSLGSWQIAQP
jgi:hypothetical protein